MGRLDRAALEAATFPISIQIPTRFDDVDLQGHINNVATMVILQEARVDFNRRVRGGQDANGLRLMVGGLVVDYAGEMLYPEPVQVFSGLSAVGRTSYTVTQVARQNGRAAVFAAVTMVFADAQGATPIPEAFRPLMAQLMLRS